MSLKDKLKKVAKVAGTAYVASKIMSGKNAKGLLAATEDGKSASSMIKGGKNLNDYNMSNNIKKKSGSVFKKLLNMGPGKNATSKKGGTLAKKILSGSTFGLDDMGGAKHGGMMQKKMNGGMMYANKGTYVKASCKLGRNKKTLIT